MSREQTPVIECKSADGITIGIIDAIITMSDLLIQRLKSEEQRHRRNKNDDHAWHSKAVEDALCDLRFNSSLRGFIFQADDDAMKLIRKAARELRSTK